MHDLLKLKFTCPKCDYITQVTPDNIIIHIVEHQPIYNTIEFQCEDCGDTFHLFGMCHFIYEADWNSFCVETVDYATASAIQAYNALYIAELDTEQLNAIIEFGVALDSLDTPDDIDWGKQ